MIRRIVNVAASMPDVWYTGIDKKYSRFTDVKHVGEGNDQMGPGIYLTTDPRDAARYGKYIHKCRIKWKKRLNAYADVDKRLLRYLINEVPDWEVENNDWYGMESGEVAKQYVYRMFLEHTNVQMVSQLIGSTTYYRDSVYKMVENLTKFGYTGTVNPAGSTQNQKYNNDVLHAVVYDPKAITILEVIDRKDII